MRLVIHGEIDDSLWFKDLGSLMHRHKLLVILQVCMDVLCHAMQHGRLDSHHPGIESCLCPLLESWGLLLLNCVLCCIDLVPDPKYLARQTQDALEGITRRGGVLCSKRTHLDTLKNSLVGNHSINGFAIVSLL